MEQFNETNTKLRLGQIYDYACKHKGALPQNIEDKIYTRFGRDSAVRTYQQTDLQAVTSVTYSNGRRFIPDGFISQQQDIDAYDIACSKFNQQTQNQLFRDEYNKIMATKNPDDEYLGEGDYFHLLLNRGILMDERIIVNLASQQQALQLSLDIAAQQKALINEVKFLAKTPPEPGKALKCDKVVIYYAKGSGNAHRNTLLAAVKNIITARGLQPIDCISAFYHKEAPGIGYGIERGNPSFTTRNCDVILKIVNGTTSLPAPVTFSGEPADRNSFIDQCYAAVTATI